MIDLENRLKDVERNAPPDLWPEIERRTPRRPRDFRRWPALLLAAALGLGTMAFAVVTLWPLGSDRAGPGAGGRPGDILYSGQIDLAGSMVGVWAVEADGSEAKPVLDDADVAEDGAVWSPDGRRIALVRSLGRGSADIWIFEPGTSSLIRVTKELEASEPTWSPDGRSIAFVRAASGIFRVDVDTGTVTEVVLGTFHSPSYSPDGTQLAMVGGLPIGDRMRSELFVVNADGSGLREITQDGGFYWDAAWATDGSGVAASWERSGPGERPDIYLIDPDDGSRRRLTDWPGWDFSPVWSPDGEYIAFVSDRDVPADEREQWGESGPYRQSLFVMEADGSDARRLVEGHDFASPTSWG